MKVIKGGRIIEENLDLLAKKDKFEKVIFDIGTGNGKWIYSKARKNPKNLYIGIEPDETQLAKISAKISKKPSKGGLSNLIFIKSSAESLDNYLANLADEVHINFPWGTLLEAVVKCEKRIIKNILKVLKPTGKVYIWFTYENKFEEKYISERNLPNVNHSYLENKLTKKYENLGFDVVGIQEFTDLPVSDMPKTSWAKQIFSERNRSVWNVNLAKKESSSNRKIYTFSCFGHPDITAKHVKTLEFTKDSEITERADCVIGVRSDFNLGRLKEFRKKVKFVCSVKDPESGKVIESEFKCTVNPNFSSNEELVLRKSMFDSPRTFGFHLNRGASRLDRKIVELMKSKKTKMSVKILDGWY